MTLLSGSITAMVPVSEFFPILSLTSPYAFVTILAIGVRLHLENHSMELPGDEEQPILLGPSGPEEHHGLAAPVDTELLHAPQALRLVELPYNRVIQNTDVAINEDR